MLKNLRRFWMSGRLLFHNLTISAGGNPSCRPPFGLLPRVIDCIRLYSKLEVATSSISD